MRRAIAALLLAGCISGDDVQGALDGYCASAAVHGCTDDVECCAGFACAAGLCRKLTPGTCLSVDAGTQTAGQGCGCDADCQSSACTSSVCR